MGILGCTLKYIYIILYLQPLDTLENLWQRPGALLHVWWFTSPLRRDGEITSPGLGEPWLVIQRCWLPWLLGWSPRVCRVATFIGSVGYELQPIFFSLMESSIRAVSTFWKLSWGLENDNALQKNDNIYLYTKTWKTVIHSSKKTTWSYINQILTVAHMDHGCICNRCLHTCFFLVVLTGPGWWFSYYLIKLFACYFICRISYILF